MNSEFFILGIVWYFIFLFSIVFHESAHVLVAYKLGDKTAYDEGRLDLNPFPYIKREIFGLLVIPIITYVLGGWMIGWASTPFDSTWAERNLKRHALMSLAGPAANFSLFLVAAIFILIGLLLNFFTAPGIINFSRITVASSPGLGDSFATILSIFFSLNLILMLFNLLPFPTFDGRSVLPLFSKGDRAIKIFHIIRNPIYSFFSVLVAWSIFGFLYRPIHLFVINLIYPGYNYH